MNENGSQDLWSYYYPFYRVLNTACNVAPGGMTCMGFGVAAAIGVKLGRPNEKVVCTTGDAAFQMEMKELPTAAQFGAPVTWVVLNNGAPGWGKSTPEADLDFRVSPDYAKIAEANQCHGETVHEPDQIRGALERALRANEEGTPAVVDFKVGVDPAAWAFPPAMNKWNSKPYFKINLFDQHIYRKGP